MVAHDPFKMDLVKWLLGTAPIFSPPTMKTTLAGLLTETAAIKEKKETREPPCA